MSCSIGLSETQTKSTKIIEGKPWVGFKLTEDGDYDMENKRLVNQ